MNTRPTQSEATGLIEEVEKIVRVATGPGTSTAGELWFIHACENLFKYRGQTLLSALRSDPQSVRRQVIEECAKVADIAAARAAFNSDNAPEQPERYYLAEEVRKAVAAAIRSLGSVPGEDR